MADDKPLTTEDLYGTSQNRTSAPVPSPAVPPPSLPIEETPEILPAPPVAPPANAPPPPPPPPAQNVPVTPKKSSGCLRTIGIILLVIGIFILGIWLSSFVRQFLPTGGGAATTQQPTPTESPVSTESATVGGGNVSSWKTYQVISGITKAPVTGLSFSLPSDVLAPICDGANCASQGTYLPGGTRFTVAPRGTGQVLPDYRGTVISDVGGIAFTTNQTTVVGHAAVEFTGSFTGRTVSGYAFTKMHGYMIALTDTTSLEINHFTPAGITADFTGDEALFTQIVATLSLTGGVSSSEKGAVLVTPTPTVTTTSTATSSGY